MRARNVKPGLFDNELLGEAGADVTLTFVGLWMMADREGRLEDRPARIRKNLFGYAETPPDVVKVLDTLASLGFIRRYQANGLALIEVVNFATHQNPHRNEKASELPPVPESKADCGSQDDSGNYPSASGHVTERPDTLGLNPDSLIPDSLIPDSLTEDGPTPDTSPSTAVPALVEQPTTLSINAQLAARSTRARTVTLPVGVSAEAFEDYLAGRTARNKPVPPSALQASIEEIVLAAEQTGTPAADVLRMMTAKGWTGVRPEWVRSATASSRSSPSGNRSGETHIERGERIAREMFADSSPLEPERRAIGSGQ